MDDYIQMGPNALFATIVLSPAWGSQYRQADRLASSRLNARAELGNEGAGEEERHIAGGEQLGLL